MRWWWEWRLRRARRRVELARGAFDWARMELREQAERDPFLWGTDSESAIEIARERAVVVAQSRLDKAEIRLEGLLKRHTGR